MKQFHVGQRVRIRQWDDMAAEYGTGEDRQGLAYIHTPGLVFWDGNMREQCGKEFVAFPDSDGDARTPCGYYITPDMCEPVEDKQPLTYADLKPGDVFEWADYANVGVKARTEQGHVYPDGSSVDANYGTRRRPVRLIVAAAPPRRPLPLPAGLSDITQRLRATAEGLNHRAQRLRDAADVLEGLS